MADGGDSFAAVDRTMRRLSEVGMNFGIRTTVTTQMVDSLERITAFVLENYPSCEQLHVEPVWECGRCKTSADEPPDLQRFIDNYLKAVAASKSTNLHIVYSGARQDIVTDAFCKAAHGGFTVTPTGDITACYEVSYRSDPRSERYFFGRYDPELGKYTIDEGKLESLGEITVFNMPYCQDCFCKWHCAGDCSAKLETWRDPANHGGSYRCEINRYLTLNQIQRRMDWSDDDA
jgi:uncharacterized protein